MTDYNAKRPLHLGCGEGLCSYLGTHTGAALGDMRRVASRQEEKESVANASAATAPGTPQPEKERP